MTPIHPRIRRARLPWRTSWGRSDDPGMDPRRQRMPCLLGTSGKTIPCQGSIISSRARARVDTSKEDSAPRLRRASRERCWTRRVRRAKNIAFLCSNEPSIPTRFPTGGTTRNVGRSPQSLFFRKRAWSISSFVHSSWQISCARRYFVSSGGGNRYVERHKEI